MKEKYVAVFLISTFVILTFYTVMIIYNMNKTKKYKKELELLKEDGKT